jgi:hypothetical protein
MFGRGIALAPLLQVTMKYSLARFAALTFLLYSASLSQERQQHAAFAIDSPSSSIHISLGKKDAGANSQVLFESALSQEINSASERIVFSGRASQSSWTLEVRLLSETGEWSSWLPVEMHWHPGGKFWAKFLFSDVTSCKRLSYRILNNGTQDTFDIQFFSINFVEAEKRDPTDDWKFLLNKVSITDTILAPALITRDQWGARPTNGILVRHTPYRGAIHHTAETRVATLEQGFEAMRYMQDLHMNGNGWKDIGYHYCIDDSGRIYQGTEVQYVASHTDNNNTGNIGVAFMGDFSAVQPTQKALAACTNLFAYLETQFPVQTDSIFGHRDYVPSTSCPGSSLYGLLPDIRSSIRQKLSSELPYIKNPQPTPFSTNVDPGASIVFNVHDDIEGVLAESLFVAVNGVKIHPTVQAVDLKEIRISYISAVPFDYSTVISVDVKVPDRATPPHVLKYHYQFTVKAKTIYNEMLTENSISDGQLLRTGDWTVSTSDVSLPELNHGVMIYAKDSLQDHRVIIHPFIKEDGNYVISLTLPRQENGLNAKYVVRNSLGKSKEEFIEYNRNYETAWFQLGTSAVYCSAGTPSTASIEIQPVPGFTTMMMLDAVRLEKQDPMLPPAMPELKSVRRISGGRIEIQWYPALEGGLLGYRVIGSSDGTTWTDTVANERTLKSADTILTLNSPPGKGVRYYKIVAVDTQRVENDNGGWDYLLSEPSDAYGLSFGIENRILVVDNFDRVGSWPYRQHTFVRNYGDALWSLGVGWESAVNDAIESGEIRLENYDIVMYMCGDDSDRDESVSNIEQLRLLRYLENGGKLFISGSEIGYDLGRPGRPDIALYNKIFKAVYQGDDSGIRECSGATGSLFAGLAFTFGAVTEDTYLEDFPDYIAPAGGGSIVLYYKNSPKVAGVSFAGIYGADTSRHAKLVYFSFPFETIYPASSRSLVMSRVMDYFGVASAVQVTSTSSPKEFSLDQNYPNPFNPSTNFEFRISAIGFVKLRIYDLLGREVATLLDERLLPGSYSVRWNAEGFPSGVYLYRLTAGSSSATKKLVLMK